MVKPSRLKSWSWFVLGASLIVMICNGIQAPNLAGAPESAVRVRIEGLGGHLGTVGFTPAEPMVVDTGGASHAVSAPTALSTIVQACRLLKLPCQVADTRLGLYLLSINGESGSWQYRVNDRLPMLGAWDERVHPGDEVVWFFDPHGCMRPLRISRLPLEIPAGRPFSVNVERFDDDRLGWQPVTEARVTDGVRWFPVTDGLARITIDDPGTHWLWAEKTDFIRSERLCLRVVDRGNSCP